MPKYIVDIADGFAVFEHGCGVLHIKTDHPTGIDISVRAQLIPEASSEKQRDTFIAKNKPKEEKKTCPLCGWVMTGTNACENLCIPKGDWLFAIGDIVILKPDASNTPRPQMVIHSFDFCDIICAWFDKDINFHKEKFSSSELLKIN